MTVYAPPPAPLFTSVLAATVVAGQSFTLVGHVMPFATVQVYDNGVLLALPTIHSNSLGYWFVTITPATGAATHSITTTEIDAFTGFVSTLSTATVLTIAYPAVSVTATTPSRRRGRRPDRVHRDAGR